MNFWVGFAVVVVATVVVFLAVSINSKTEQAGDHGGHAHH